MRTELRQLARSSSGALTAFEHIVSRSECDMACNSLTNGSYSLGSTGLGSAYVKGSEDQTLVAEMNRVEFPVSGGHRIASG